MKDENVSLLICMLFSLIASMVLYSSWESHLNNLNKKPVAEAIKENNSKYSHEQMQGLMNDIKQ